MNMNMATRVRLWSMFTRSEGERTLGQTLQDEDVHAIAAKHGINSSDCTHQYTTGDTFPWVHPKTRKNDDSWKSRPSMKHRPSISEEPESTPGRRVRFGSDETSVQCAVNNQHGGNCSAVSNHQMTESGTAFGGSMTTVSTFSSRHRMQRPMRDKEWNLQNIFTRSKN